MDKEYKKIIYKIAMKSAFFLFFFVAIVSCKTHKHKQKKESIGSSKINIQVKNKSDLPLLMNRLQTYSKITRNKVISKVDNNDLRVEIFDLLNEKQIIDLFRLNGPLLMKGKNDSILTEEKFHISLDTLMGVHMKFVFDSIHRNDLETFSKNNLNQKTELFLGDTCIATPIFREIIKNGYLGFSMPRYSNIYVIYAAIKARYPHKVEFKTANFQARFKDSIISDNLFRQYQSIKKSPIGSFVYDGRQKLINKHLDTYKMKVLNKLTYNYQLIAPIYLTDLISFIKNSDFKDYNELKSFLFQLNLIQEGYKNGILSKDEVVKRVINLEY